MGITPFRKLIFAGLLLTLVNPVFPARAGEDRGITLLEAVARTMEHQPTILLQKQEVSLARGRFQQASGQFDTVFGTTVGHDHEDLPLSQAEKISLGLSNTVNDSTNYGMDLTRQLRSGITLIPSFSIVRSSGYNSSVGAYSSAYNQSQVSFLVSVPLLRGRGAEAADAQEMASKSDYEAGKMSMRFALSCSALDTITAYWTCLAAGRNLHELREAENRARRMFDETKTLIDHDELPQAELTQVQANLEDKRVARIGGEQTLFEAAQALGLAMGLTRSDLASVPPPTDNFPAPELDRATEAGQEAGAMTEIALGGREDFHAAKQQQETARILLAAAENNLLPKLNANVKVGYSGLKDDSGVVKFFSSLDNQVPGASVVFQLRYEWPVQNNAARGLLAQQLAARNETVIKVMDLERKISSSVLIALSALERSSDALAKARSSTRFYESAVVNEKKKFQLGISTLIDVITVEDRATTAKLNEIKSMRDVAIALAQLRFVTGTLLNAKDDKISVGAAELTTVPNR